MSNDMEFTVQYKDANGTWRRVCGSFTRYAEACSHLLEEATNDPEYDHRIVRSQVLGYITGRGNIDE